MKIDPQSPYEKLRHNPLAWTLNSVVLPRGQKWKFDGERAWQVALFTDMSKNMVVKKSAQVGMSTTTLCRVLHYLSYYPITCMYTLPRRDDVSDFVNLYVDPVISASPSLTDRIKNTGDKVVNSKRIKRFRAGLDQGSSFLIFMEATVEPRMIPVDLMVNDEIDRSDPDNIEIFEARQEESTWKINWKFSTPSIDAAGIDAYWVSSSQNFWHTKCPQCNQWNRLNWDDNFREPVGKQAAHLGCERCDRKIMPREITEGQWISVGNRGDDVPAGYQVSNLLLPYSRPIPELWEKLRTVKRIKNFYNLVLGESFSTPGGSISADAMRQHCFKEPFPQEAAKVSGQYFVGMDQGNDIHVVIGKAYGEQLRIIAALRIPYADRDGFGRLSNIIRSYDAVTIMDSEPNKHSARKVMDEFSRGTVFLGKYNRIADEIAYGREKGGQLNGSLSISKTEAFDDLRDTLLTGRIQLWSEGGYLHPTVLEIIDHCTNIKRDEIAVSLQHGEQVMGVWKPTGPDHYAHALVMCFLGWKFIRTGGFKMVAAGMTEQENERVLEAFRKHGRETTATMVERAQEQARVLAPGGIGDLGDSTGGRSLRIA